MGETLLPHNPKGFQAAILASYTERVQWRTVLLLTALLSFTLGCASRLAPPPSFSPPPSEQIRKSFDRTFQHQMDAMLQELELKRLVHRQELAFAVLDMGQPDMRLAGFNLDMMMYAASLPKIAILFAGLKKASDGEAEWSSRERWLARHMIQRSSNKTATELFYRVGPEYIARLLQSPAYRFYDAKFGGGLWIGKEYGKRAAWRREPLLHLSHAATPFQVIRFYHALENGNLLPPKATVEMKRIMAKTELPHKFIRAMAASPGKRRYLRKSGTWGHFHSDSILVDDGANRFILAGLTKHPYGAQVLEILFLGVQTVVASSPNGPRLLKGKIEKSRSV